MTTPSGRAVILLSGGIDSTVALAAAKLGGRLDLHALSIRYGQRHAIELSLAAQVARQYGVPHKVVNVDLSSFGGSELFVGSSGGPLKTVGVIPPTYVPARNTVFLSIASAMAEAIGATTIIMGVNSDDASGYPDCRRSFFDAFEATIRLGTRTADGAPAISVMTPFVRKTKAQIVEYGALIGVNFSQTSSCYCPNALGMPCCSCGACLLRAAAFDLAGVIDPVRADLPTSEIPQTLAELLVTDHEFAAFMATGHLELRMSEPPGPTMYRRLRCGDDCVPARISCFRQESDEATDDIVYQWTMEKP